MRLYLRNSVFDALPPLVPAGETGAIAPSQALTQAPRSGLLLRLGVMPGLFLGGGLGLNPAAQAQVIPDGSLPNNSTVTTTPLGSGGSQFAIGGGSLAGANLFHSFATFSVAAGDVARFAPESSVERIFSRVTGEQASYINGTLGSDGTADLFLLNPHGVLFGPDAALNLGGSLIVSSGDRILFADGNDFTASPANSSANSPSDSSGGSPGNSASGNSSGNSSGNLSGSSLLSLSVPVGIQLGAAPGPLAIRGAGSNFQLNPDTSEIFKGLRSGGLTVPDTLGLIGGPISLVGGNVMAGDAAIAALSSGSIELLSDGLGWRLGNSSGSALDIELSQAASVDVSGSGGGRIQLRGRDVAIAEGATLLSETLGNGLGRAMEISASQSLTLFGAALEPSGTQFPSSIAAEVAAGATGQGGSITIQTPNLAIVDGAAVSTSTYGLGNGGSLTVTAPTIDLVGSNAFGPSAIGSVVGFSSNARGGDIVVTTEQLSGAGGGSLTTVALGPGQGGSVGLTGNEIRFSGGSGDAGPSGIFAGSILGQSGDLELESDRLSLDGGAQISASTFGPGDGGSIRITANQTVLSGTSPNGTSTSGIFASVSDPNATGNGGSIDLTVERLTITDGARVTTTTRGQGNAGSLTMGGGAIDLAGVSADGQNSGLFSVVDLGATGMGGQIQLSADQLSLSAGAQVAVATAGPGNAGDLTINAAQLDLQGTGATANPTGQTGLFASAIVNDGAGGNIRIRSDAVSLGNGATINASNFSTRPDVPPGSGAAGNVEIMADELELDNRARITTATVSGDRGNITLQSRLIALRRASLVNASALTNATGGNIVINSDFIAAVADENSDITANAEQGQGGQVDVTTEGLFGIEFRDQLTSASDITAFSEAGLDGTVSINQLSPEPISGVPELPADLGDRADQITAGCPADRGATFIASGRGGLPDGPGQGIQDYYVLHSLATEPSPHSPASAGRVQAATAPAVIVAQTSPGNRLSSGSPPSLLPPEQATAEFSPGSRAPSKPRRMAEAQGWQRNSQGQLELVAQRSSGLTSAQNAASPRCLREVL